MDFETEVRETLGRYDERQRNMQSDMQEIKTLLMNNGQQLGELKTIMAVQKKCEEEQDKAIDAIIVKQSKTDSTVSSLSDDFIVANRDRKIAIASVYLLAGVFLTNLAKKIWGGG
jgi:hypothetical protein